MSLGSSAVVLFIRARPGVVVYIRDRWAHSSSLRWSLGSSGVIGFTRVHSGGRSVYLWSLCSLVRSLGVVRFIRGRWVDSIVTWGRWVRSRAPQGSCGLSGVVGFTCARPGRR